LPVRWCKISWKEQSDDQLAITSAKYKHLIVL
jgi:hypothetical protein